MLDPALPKSIGPLRGADCIKRYENNPVLSASDMPYPATLIFNAGITKFNGRYVMVFRNDLFEEKSERPRAKSISLGFASSSDGINWEVSPKPCLTADKFNDPNITGVYDPRLTVIDGRCYVCFATNTFHGLRAGIAVTDDFEKFEILHLTTPDNRNMVLFPEKIDGNFVRLERPFPVYGRLTGPDAWITRFDVWLSESPDMCFWGKSRLTLGVEDVPFCNDKIGPGAPPIKTSEGWLTTFHAVDIDETRGKNGWEKVWPKRYTAGIMLLDLDDPSKVIGMSKEPLMVPETDYETSGGFRDNVIFPGGMVLEDSGEVKIYYGAGDAIECMATADLGDLLALCKKNG